MTDAELFLNPGCRLGEGPLWDEDAQALWWVDILAGELHRYTMETKTHDVFDVGQHVGTVGLRASGGLVLALANGFATFDPESGELTPITDPEANKPNNRFNDGKPAPDGSFFAGTMAYDVAEGAASLYRLAADGSVERVFTDVTISNGLAWNAAEDTMYYIDTVPHRVWAFDYDRQTGAISNERIAIQVPDDLGSPDGMTIDTGDKLWIAHYDGYAVRRWDPQTGDVLDEIAIPTPQVTCPTFGGPDYRTLFITTGAQGMSPEDREADPMAGALFRAELPVGGRAPYRFAG